MLCQRCWYEARTRADGDGSKKQWEHYADLLWERRLAPCSEGDQVGRLPLGGHSTVDALWGRE